MGIKLAHASLLFRPRRYTKMSMCRTPAGDDLASPVEIRASIIARPDCLSVNSSQMVHSIVVIRWQAMGWCMHCVVI